MLASRTQALRLFKTLNGQDLSSLKTERIQEILRNRLVGWCSAIEGCPGLEESRKDQLKEELMTLFNLNSKISKDYWNIVIKIAKKLAEIAPGIQELYRQDNLKSLEIIIQDLRDVKPDPKIVEFLKTAEDCKNILLTGKVEDWKRMNGFVTKVYGYLKLKRMKELKII